jgi:putative FmdB family regulatory protein
MPIYDYMCKACEHQFEESLSMSNLDKPTKNPCPKCGKKQVKKTMGGFPSVASDEKLTPNRATGGRWNELMNQMKPGLPSRMRDGLDKGHTGRRWMG